MPYPDYLTAPMRQELTDLGIRECRTAAEVDCSGVCSQPWYVIDQRVVHTR